MEAEPEENEFTLEGLVVSRRTTSATTKTAPKAAHKRGELFARITERHLNLLANVPRFSSALFFHRLMIESVKRSHRPFTLKTDELAIKTGLNRWSQARALRELAAAGLIVVERDGRKKPPLISIPGTTRR